MLRTRGSALPRAKKPRRHNVLELFKYHTHCVYYVYRAIIQRHACACGWSHPIKSKINLQAQASTVFGITFIRNTPRQREWWFYILFLFVSKIRFFLSKTAIIYTICLFIHLLFINNQKHPLFYLPEGNRKPPIFCEIDVRPKTKRSRHISPLRFRHRVRYLL